MKQYQFFIPDRQGTLYSVHACEFVTSQGGVALAFVLRTLRLVDTAPLLYVRYPISKPRTGSVYHEFNYFSGKFVERVSIRQFFPSWDMRKIRKEWRCLNG